MAPQNFVEFREVATRPAAVNGLGLTPDAVEAELDRLDLLFALLPEDGFYRHWRDLCRQAGVSGKQVHDTRFVPSVPELVVLTPDQVLAGA